MVFAERYKRVSRIKFDLALNWKLLRGRRLTLEYVDSIIYINSSYSYVKFYYVVYLLCLIVHNEVVHLNDSGSVFKENYNQSLVFFLP